MQNRRQRLELAPSRRQQQQQLPGHRYSIAEEKGGRMRRPTAIMRANVEVARLMGMPGSKQRNLSQDDMTQEEEAPQHLSTTRSKKCENVVVNPITSTDHHNITDGAPPSSSSCHSDGGPQSAIKSHVEDKRDRSGGSRSVSGRSSGGSRHGISHSQAARPVPLPVVQAMPPALGEQPLVLTNVSVQAIISATLPTSELTSTTAMNGRPIQGVLVRAASNVVDVNPHKRKRRPPGWLAEHEQGEEELMDDDEEDLQAPTSAAAPSDKRRNAETANKKRPIACVSASVCSNADEDEHGLVQSVPCAVAVLGVLPPAAARSRGSMPPPVATSTSIMSERSPKSRQHSSSSNDKERERKLQRDSSRDGKEAVGEDAYQISFGDLPSPRMIEVVRAKEIHLPQWRLLPMELVPAPLLSGWVPPRRATEHSKDRRGGTHTKSRRIRSHAGGDEDISEVHSNEDRGDDELYERRHVRTLERAIAAARSVARMLAQKERQKQQQATSDGKPGDGPRNLTEEEEWRFRPSELAALCAAQRMGPAESVETADVARHAQRSSKPRCHTGPESCSALSRLPESSIDDLGLQVRQVFLAEWVETAEGVMQTVSAKMGIALTIKIRPATRLGVAT